VYTIIFHKKNYLDTVYDTKLRKVRTVRGAMASGWGMGLRFSSRLYTRGTPVGMFRPAITSSGMLSKYFTRARREFPVGIGIVVGQ
jgi:hypothetical protein